MMSEVIRNESCIDTFEAFERIGYSILRSWIPSDTLLLLQQHCSNLLKMTAKQKPAGLRNLLRDDAFLYDIAMSEPLRSTASRLLTKSAIPVRIILFDKSPDANWSVPWHQDINIAVEGHIDDTNYGPWSIKEGVSHVIPPREILEDMVTLRIHLDPCNDSNGPLRVIPQSHRGGVLKEKQLDSTLLDSQAVELHADVGDIVVMRPLLLHSSKRATSKQQRRVLHIEYSAAELPRGLQWYFHRALQIGSE